MQLAWGRDRIYNPLPLFHINCQGITAMGAILTANCLILPERFSPGALVARHRRHPRDRRPLPRRGAAAPAQPGAGARGARARGEVRPRRRRGAAAARRVREALRLSPDRGVGHDRDRTPLRRRDGAAPDIHAGLRASGRRLPGARGRRRRSRGRARDRGRAARSLGRARGATSRLLRQLPQERRGHRRGVAGRLVPHRATSCARRPTACCTSSTARRTSSGGPARTSRPRRSRRRCRPTRRWPRSRCSRCPTRSARRRSWPASWPWPACAPDRALAEELFEWCRTRLAYFKAPGWVLFVPSLPTTGTQKVQKTQIFPRGEDPRAVPGVIDLRDRKRRG